MPLFLLSFIAGVLTILAPCVLPLLPVIIGGSLSDVRSRLKPYVITASLAGSIVVFTLALKASTVFIDIPQSFWTWFSAIIIFFFGLTLLFPVLWEKLPGVSKLSSSSNKLVGQGASRKSFTGDILMGAALGPVFASCSPTYFLILATVLPADFALGFVYLILYALGLGIALLAIALLGQKLTSKLDWATDPSGWFKKTLGVIFIIVALGIATGYDKKLEVAILDAGFFDITQVENALLNQLEEPSSTDTDNQDVENQNDQESSSTSGNKTNQSQSSASTFLSPEEKAKKYKKFIELSSPDGFVNTNGEPITIQSLLDQNKVVLLDIWTYSCINCQRTLPYLNAWYDSYRDQGLEIIGLHTPEFAFEKNYDNVAEATKNFGIEYPVVLDNDYSTWRALKNNFWPRKYLIDIDGYIVYDRIGEGGYDTTEQKIQTALAERAARLGENLDTSNIVKPQGVVVVDTSKPRSPETYFGAWRNDNFANGTKRTVGVQELASVPSNIVPHMFFLRGTWDIQQEYAENTTEPASIIFRYQGQNVYMVASADNPVEIEIWRDGQFLTKDTGIDISPQNSRGTVQEERLYHIIGDDSHGEHTLEICILNPGLKAFTFTFG